MANRKVEQKEICERLRDLIAWRKRVDGMTQNDFALLVGSKPTTFLDYLKPKDQSKIRLELLNNIVSAFPQVNREWLFWGEGEMLMAQEQRPACSQVLGADAATRDALLEKLLARNEELQDKILGLTRENASLKTRMEFLADEGEQTQAPGGTIHPSGEDTAE